ncbi:hypothetical protein AVP3_0001 [Aeromonas phage AVP3]
MICATFAGAGCNPTGRSTFILESEWQARNIHHRSAVYTVDTTKDLA